MREITKTRLERSVNFQNDESRKTVPVIAKEELASTEEKSVCNSI